MPYNVTTVELVYYGHLGTNHKCPDYQGVLIFQVSLCDKAPLGAITKYVDYAGVLINRFHCDTEEYKICIQICLQKVLPNT